MILMKLAEALLERKALKEQIAQLKRRMETGAVVQDGDAPPEDLSQIMEHFRVLVKKLEQLIIAINHTNHQTVVPGQGSLMEMIAARDMLKLRMDVLDAVVDEASVPKYRVSRSEIRLVPAIDIAKWRQEFDALAKEYRELDAKIQAVNWTVDLAE